jgi:CBS domain-containing protein
LESLEAAAMTKIESKPIDSISVSPEASIRDALEVISRAADFGAPIGIALVLDDEGRLLGLVTDGDIRRAIVSEKPLDTPLSEVMTKSPVTVPAGISGDDMIRQMREKVRSSGHIRDTKVEHLVTVDEKGRAVDVFNSFDLLMRTDMRNWTVGVLGLGFVGLTLAVSLAETGYVVHGVDSNEDLVDSLKRA